MDAPACAATGRSLVTTQDAAMQFRVAHGQAAAHVVAVGGLHETCEQRTSPRAEEQANGEDNRRTPELSVTGLGGCATKRTLQCSGGHAHCLASRLVRLARPACLDHPSRCGSGPTVCSAACTPCARVKLTMAQQNMAHSAHGTSLAPLGAATTSGREFSATVLRLHSPTKRWWDAVSWWLQVVAGDSDRSDLGVLEQRMQTHCS